MRYRRVKMDGGTYFFTLVTYQRAPLFSSLENCGLLREAFRQVMEKHPFSIDAFVLLPDHLHCIWTLPGGDRNYSMRWRMIKSQFTRECKKQKVLSQSNAARARKQEQTVWQRRFWEHTIRDAHDYRKHVEYIHFNPVKHGHAERPAEWKYSSFHRFVRQGIYPESWGRHPKDYAFEEDILE
ncbi:putative transposase [Desulfatibacillum alkenivorans DSM 16219]|uniref:Putative transposase n=1 Tax=Desulfatibacillum alkenivorans DSM 16219 TaxID=1121393 RepID=A0A1M6TZI5_9BACT|nr:transposase [Desulfatibacillum alkenivorans]SHK62294.1 putative transposase [Desulfatibacillum alkenivorans DSM 16219]